MNIDYLEIGTRIKAARKGMRITQEQLAEYLDVSVGYVSQLERGVTKISLDTLGRISARLDTPITFFLSGVSVSQADYLSTDLMTVFNGLPSEKRRLLLEIAKLLSAT